MSTSRDCYSTERWREGNIAIDFALLLDPLILWHSGLGSDFTRRRGGYGPVVAVAVGKWEARFTSVPGSLYGDEIDANPAKPSLAEHYGQFVARCGVLGTNASAASRSY
jgi:hypothetical protein